MESLHSLSRSFSLLSAVVEDQGQSALPVIAADIHLPLSTAYRMVDQLLDQRLLIKIEKGKYLAGPSLFKLSKSMDPMTIFAKIARPHLRRLVGRKKVIAHLGVWDGEMVTYLVKESGIGQSLFTQEGGKLEAYCSAIGRVLLAHLPQEECDAYLSDENFVPLTQRTETDPEIIKHILTQARKDGFASDQEEIAEGLNCIAVPVTAKNGKVLAALSLSSLSPRNTGHRKLPTLRKCSKNISGSIAEYHPMIERELAAMD